MVFHSRVLGHGLPGVALRQPREPLRRLVLQLVRDAPAHHLPKARPFFSQQHKNAPKSNSSQDEPTNLKTACSRFETRGSAKTINNCCNNSISIKPDICKHGSNSHQDAEHEHAERADLMILPVLIAVHRRLNIRRRAVVLAPVYTSQSSMSNSLNCPSVAVINYEQFTVRNCPLQPSTK